LILDGHVTGLFQEHKGNSAETTCAKRKLNINGGAWNDEGMEGGNRSNAVVFWQQVLKKAELWSAKNKFYVYYPL
jgi:hypothetical protein